jgi:hypothetical protein
MHQSINTPVSRPETLTVGAEALGGSYRPGLSDDIDEYKRLRYNWGYSKVCPLHGWDV